MEYVSGGELFDYIVKHGKVYHSLIKMALFFNHSLLLLITAEGT
jgi:hypothetical protein